MNHGTASGYTSGCRCVPCTAAKTENYRQYRAGLRSSEPSTATRRRVQALQAMGWSLTHLAVSTGLTRETLGQLFLNERVYSQTATKVSASYVKLRFHKGPSEASVRRARRNGWPTSIGWNERTIGDPDAEPTVLPQSLPMKRADYIEEYEWLRACGESKIQAAARLGVTVAWLEDLIAGKR